MFNSITWQSNVFSRLARGGWHPPPKIPKPAITVRLIYWFVTHVFFFLPLPSLSSQYTCFPISSPLSFLVSLNLLPPFCLSPSNQLLFQTPLCLSLFSFTPFLLSLSNSTLLSLYDSFGFPIFAYFPLSSPSCSFALSVFI